MEDSKTKTWFTNRQFVAAIRDELDASGHPDIAISRQWIDEDTPGDPFLLHVPVGAALTIPLRPLSDFGDVRDRKGMIEHARHFAKALANLKRAQKTLEKYAREVRAAAVAEIDVARRAGLDVLLDSVGFKPTRAYHLNGQDWKDAASFVLAEVNVRHTSFFLRPRVTAVAVEEPADVANELADMLNDQRERQERIAELDALGADLIVDQITLDLLAAHGLDAQEVLERVWKKQCVNLTVEHNGRDTHLSLISSHGLVTASILMEDAIWNGEHLWFCGDEHLKDHKHLIGKSVGDLVRHPVFASRPIVDVFHRHADHVVFDLSDKVMFEADSGRLWREERLAA